MLLLLMPFGASNAPHELEQQTPKGMTVNQSAENQGNQLANNSSNSLVLVESNHSTIWLDRLVKELRQLLSKNHYKTAVALIDENYQQASADELERFKGLVLAHADKLILTNNVDAASELLKAYAQTFDDVDAWRTLGSVSAKLADWNLAITALLNTSRLEYRPDAIEETMQAIIRASNNVRASLERQDDQLGILSLYQRIYRQHPDYPRFQLELAQSYLRLGDDESARPYLETLQYDPELGALGKQKIAALNKRRNARQAELKKSTNKRTAEQTTDNRNSDIVVPLIRAGNSFLVEALINKQRIRLLLDTGASITALSSESISRLKLTPTGRYIQLSTANGMRKSQLYLANQITLGRLTMSRLLVAEITLENTQNVQGLLGTDLLNQLDNRYSFLIDNQQNSLIFRVK